jgi:hypothetical protein
MSIFRVKIYADSQAARKQQLSTDYTASYSIR